MQCCEGIIYWGSSSLRAPSRKKKEDI